MIEVQLQERERNHPALELPFWNLRQGRFWDSPCVEDMTREQKRVLVLALSEIMEIFEEHYHIPFCSLVKDFEICGSRGFGNNTVFSDMDIQISTEDEENQRLIAEKINSDYKFFNDEVIKLSKRLKIYVDLGFSEWKNKQYNECYSLRDNKLYNRNPHEFKDKLYRRVYNPSTGRYDVENKGAEKNISSMHWDENGDECLRTLEVVTLLGAGEDENEEY